MIPYVSLCFLNFLYYLNICVSESLCNTPPASLRDSDHLNNPIDGEHFGPIIFIWDQMLAAMGAN